MFQAFKLWPHQARQLVSGHTGNSPGVHFRQRRENRQTRFETWRRPEADRIKNSSNRFSNRKSATGAGWNYVFANAHFQL